MNRPRQNRRGAFTLIEIMVAVMVFSMVIASIYATWALVMRATQVGQDAAAQAQRQRVVLRAIGDAVMGIESFQASPQYYWFNLVNGDEPSLSFVAHLPDTYPRTGKFVGAAGGHDASTRRVMFSLETGADGEKDLVLRQKPILMDMDEDEKKYPLVLARNVRNFTIEWWGTNEMNEAAWNTDWNDNQTNTFPRMLRVHLELGANTAKGKDAPTFSATRIYAVSSQMMPVMVQRGIGGPLGGPGGPGGLVLPPPGAQPPGGVNQNPQMQTPGGLSP
jgi:prepilin-type N-terminal cleavage/methylation domain-containing protein